MPLAGDSVARMATHLKVGGVLVIERWVSVAPLAD
jgi:hypothetical protein